MSVEKLSDKYFPSISRRKFIKDIAILGAATAAAVFTTGFVPHDGSELGEASFSLRKPDNPSKQLDQKVPSDLVEDFSGNGFPEDSIGRNRIEEQISHYEKDPNLPVRIAQSLKWEDLIYQCAGKLNINRNDFIVSSLSALIFVESEGDPVAVNRDSGARGLCQITWESAKAEYDKIPEKERGRLGLSLTKPDDLYDTKTNILLGMIILTDLAKTLPDPSLTFWAFHFGQGRVYKSIDIFIAGKEPIDVQASNNVERYKLNFFKIINDKNVRIKLGLDSENNDLNDTEFYVPRIMAAKYFLNK
jgi:hypothetical protein